MAWFRSNLHFTRLPDEIAQIETEPVCAASEHAVASTTAQAPRRAAVSSYGLSGTNVHAILEQAPEADCARRACSGRSPTTAPLLFPAVVHVGRRTAPTPPAGWPTGSRRTGPSSRCRTWATRWRAGARTDRCAPPLCASSLAELTEALREVADGDTPYQPAVGQDDRGPVWVFSGQGSQWAAMGADLLANEPVFAATIAAVGAADRRRIRLLGDRGDVGARM